MLKYTNNYAFGGEQSQDVISTAFGLKFLAVCWLSVLSTQEWFLAPDSSDLLSLNLEKVAMAAHLLVTLPLIAMRFWRQL